MESTETSSPIQERVADYSKFIDDQVIRHQRKVVQDTDSPLRAQERVKRRSPGDVTVIR